MKAMILAAGQGTRLKPFTDSKPKALIEVAGTPILEIVIRKLKAAGVRELVINLHHKAEMIEEFLKSRGDFGLGIAFSKEEVLLETGGGLKQAAPLLGKEDFFLHNADVVSTVDLGALSRAHQAGRALATLSVRKRDSSRQLLFDRDGSLRGRRASGQLPPASGERPAPPAPSGERSTPCAFGDGGPVPPGTEVLSRQSPAWAGAPAEGAEELAFDGIHAVSPAIFELMTETGAFPITGTYLRLAGEGRPSTAFRSDGSLWAEIGSAEKLDAATRMVADKGLPAFLS